MHSPHAGTPPHCPTEYLTESENKQSATITIDEDLDAWIRELHLSTLPKGFPAPLTITELLDGKVVTDIALAQELIIDSEVMFNSPEKLFRLVVERLYESESVDSQKKIVEWLVMGDIVVLEEILHALKDLRQPRHTQHCLENVETQPGHPDYFDEGEKRLSLDSICSEAWSEGECCPFQVSRSMSLVPSSSCSVDAVLEEKCHELSRELSQTVTIAEGWKQKYQKMNIRLNAVQENNDVLENTLKVKMELAEKHEKQIREITSNYESEKEEMLMSIRELSKCARDETMSFQKELKSLKSLLAYEQQCITEISEARRKVSRSNAELYRHKAELSSELMTLRWQLKKTRENLKQKLNRANEEHENYKKRWEHERTDLLESIQVMMEERIVAQKTIESTPLEEKLSILHDDVEEALFLKKRIRNKVDDREHLDVENGLVISNYNIKCKKLMQNRMSNPFNLLSLLIFLLVRVLRKSVGL